MDNCVLLNYAALQELLKMVAFFNATYDQFDDEEYTNGVYACIGRKALNLLDEDESLKLILKK